MPAELQHPCSSQQAGVRLPSDNLCNWHAGAQSLLRAAGRVRAGCGGCQPRDEGVLHNSDMLWCLACLLNEPLLDGCQQLHAVQGPCRSTAASRACCSMRKRSCSQPARRDVFGHHRLLIQLLLHSLLPTSRYDASLSCTPPPQEVYDQLRGAKNALRKLLGKRVSTRQRGCCVPPAPAASCALRCVARCVGLVLSLAPLLTWCAGSTTLRRLVPLSAGPPKHALCPSACHSTAEHM